jgi:lipoprotein-releasing system permease protein
VFELLIGWRYTKAGKSSRRNGFISFISAVSMTGIALGVAALIIVLSVMNGFQKEVRDRMISVLAHIEILSGDGQSLENYEDIKKIVLQNPDVVATSPFVYAQVLMARGDEMRGALIRGVDARQESAVADVLAQIPAKTRALLFEGSYNVVLGSELARALGVEVGDPVTLIAPSGQVTPAGVLPRLKQLKVIALLDTGHYDFDSSLVLISIQDAQRIFRLTGPMGMRLKLKDPQQARAVAELLTQSLAPQLFVRDWTRLNKTWFSAVQIEKRMMFIILTLIVAVAAFNLVSTLVMTVTDKRADIAILRTMGASARSILFIFIVQGALIGVGGTLIGALLGLSIALNIDVIVPAIEHVLGLSFLPRDIYLISKMPSDPQGSDIWPIVVISLLLSLFATIYPSWRASRVQPAQALRYE